MRTMDAAKGVLALGAMFVTFVAGGQATADPPPPVSLEQYAKTNRIADRAGGQFVTLRCGALYLFSAGILEKDNPDMAIKFREAAKRFITTAITVSDDNEFVKDQIVRMSAMYSERAKAAKANTGNIFDDPILRDDMEFCRLLAS